MSQHQPHPPSINANHDIVLFDGQCKLCNRTVAFIMKHDPAGRFIFASAHSPQGQALAKKLGFTGPTPGSIVLLSGNQMYTKSTASLQIARRLNGIWPVLFAFILIPPFIRDAMYGIIARNRRRWFGAADQCVMIPPARRFQESGK